MASSTTELPLGRIILCVIVVFALLGFGIAWYSGMEAEKEATTYYAKAQDDFQNNRLESSLIAIDKALALKEKPEFYQTKVNILIN
jgi:hypothetical protein